VGIAKHEVLITYGDPVGSTPLAPFIGSQITFGRALISPPVKLVMAVHRIFVLPAIAEGSDPGGHVCPALMSAVPPS
jgi:hypothetical protein